MTSLTGDILLDSKKYRIARREQGIAFKTSTRAIETGEGDWEIVIDDWSGGMGLAELPTGRQYTNRFYYSQDFDTTIPRILRPRQPINNIDVSTDTPGPILSAFEDRIGGTDYVYLHYLPDGGSVTSAKISNNSATPTLVETTTTSNTSDRAGQPVKAYSSAASDEVWFVPLQNGSRIRRLQTLPGTRTVGSGQTQHWNLLSSTTLYGMNSRETGAGSVTMDWSTSASGAWATVGVPIKPASSDFVWAREHLETTSSGSTTITIDDVRMFNANRLLMVGVSIRNNSQASCPGQHL